MAEKDRMYAEERRFREEINRLESQRNNLLKERERLDINSEASFSRAQNIRLALSKIEEDIQNSKIKQYQTSLKISEIEKEQLNKTKVTEDLQKND